MSSDLTCIEIIARWIETAIASSDQRAVKFQSHHLHTHVLPWAKKNYDKTFNPSTYQRRFRELKSDRLDILQKHGIKTIDKVEQSYGSEATWIAHAQEGVTLTNYNQT